MGADPEPDDPIGGLDAHGPVTGSDACRPEAADLLEMKRRMMGILLEKIEVAVGDAPDRCRERAIAAPEIRRRVMIQSLVVAPEA